MPAAGAIASVAGSVISSNNAKEATNAQIAQGDKAIGEQRRQFDMVRADTQPGRQIGTNAMYRLADIFGLNYDLQKPVEPDKKDFRKSQKPGFNIMDPLNMMGGLGQKLNPYTGLPTNKDKEDKVDKRLYAKAYAQYEQDLAKYRRDREAFNNRKTGVEAFQADPGYQFRLNEGNKALDRMMSAGRVTGGRAIKEAMRYGQDFASNEFGNSVGRMFTLAGFGPVGVNTSAAAGTNAANQIGQIRLNQGNALAEGYANQNNAMQSGINNLMTYQAYQKAGGMPTQQASSFSVPTNAPYWTSRGY